jgi:hypothetical protein
MSEHMNASENMDITENVDIEKKQASIRTALSVLAFSLVLQVTYYLWQTYCC